MHKKENSLSTEVHYAKATLQSMQTNTATRSIVYISEYISKTTMLLNSIKKIAYEMDILCEYIKADSKTEFIGQFTAISQMLVKKISAQEKTEKLVANIIETVKVLSISFGSENGSIAEKENELFKVVDLSKTLTDVVVALGKAAKISETPIVIFIDKIQHLKIEEFSALATALHRANQLDYPIMIISAGSPHVRRSFGNAKSYSERLFEYRQIWE